MPVLDEVLRANEEYAAGFAGSALAMRPSRGLAVLTCMDARLDPAKFAGLAEGDAHVIRNAGGRASDDAIRSLVISHTLLGTQEFFVIHHTGCGMETFTNEKKGELLGPEAGEIDWLTFPDATQAVADDVAAIRAHPLVPESIPIYGFMYEVETGKLVEVPAATEAGKVP
jgi:carbonic anhydrase